MQENLEENLSEGAEDFSYTFYQDESPKHKLWVTMRRLRSEFTHVVKWFSQNSDLNSIQNVWKKPWIYFLQMGFVQY